MQGDAAKNAIVAEAGRVLRPRGRYAIHELALTPDDVPDDICTEVRQSLARASNTFRKHQERMAAVAIVAYKPAVADC